MFFYGGTYMYNKWNKISNLTYLKLDFYEN
jgi:hypothetical protein